MITLLSTRIEEVKDNIAALKARREKFEDDSLTITILHLTQYLVLLEDPHYGG